MNHKNRFIAILISVDSNFPLTAWDRLLPHATLAYSSLYGNIDDNRVVKNTAAGKWTSFATYERISCLKITGAIQSSSLPLCQNVNSWKWISPPRTTLKNAKDMFLMLKTPEGKQSNRSITQTCSAGKIIRCATSQGRHYYAMHQCHTSDCGSISPHQCCTEWPNCSGQTIQSSHRLTQTNGYTPCGRRQAHIDKTFANKFGCCSTILSKHRKPN